MYADLRYLFYAVVVLVSITGNSNTLRAQVPETFLDDRDGHQYALVQIGELFWFKENLRFETERSMRIPSEGSAPCGVFYDVTASFEVCPSGWRLPNEKEVKALLKLDKKDKIALSDTLEITLCGRVDNGNHTRDGDQNTFWIESELVDGYITHWHTFGDEQELHNHNVVNAQRMFPVRCVRPIDE